MRKNLLILLLLLPCIATAPAHRIETADETAVTEMPKTVVIPTKYEFIAECQRIGIHFPHIVYAQARLESGNFKSGTYRNKNNCLGLYDSRRKCYRTFSCWQDCVLAYRDKVQYKYHHQPSHTDQDYLAWLAGSGYAEDSAYIEKITNILRKL